MGAVKQITVNSDESGLRLDRWFRIHFPALGHGQLQKLLRKGQVRVDGGRSKANMRLETGQVIRVPPLGEDAEKKPKRPGSALSDEDRDFIRSLEIYRDQNLIAINKPTGLAVQGGTKTRRHLDGLIGGLVEVGEERPRLVHRLDRDTSGVMLLARTRTAARELSDLLKRRSVSKIYWALVEGVPREFIGTIKLPLIKSGRHGEERVRPANPGEKDGQYALSDYQVIDHAGQKFSWLAMKPVTGRTHQLRVHAAEIGHPIVGDPKYGSRDDRAESEHDVDFGLENKLHLHARSITLPQKGKVPLTIVAPLPEHMENSWSALGFEEKSGDDCQL